MEVITFLKSITVYKADDGVVWCLPQFIEEATKKYGEQVSILPLNGYRVESEEAGIECVKLIEKYLSDVKKGKLDITVLKGVQGDTAVYEVHSPKTSITTKAVMVAHEQLIMLLAEHYTDQGREALSNLAKALLLTVTHTFGG